MISNDNLEKYSKYLIIFVPMITVYIPTISYPATNTIGSNVSFRPPGVVFAIVWPILLTLLGISWFQRINMNKFINSIYSTLTILLAIWFILYDNNKWFGLTDIILCFFITLYLYRYNYKQFNPYASYTLIPLLLWLSFATILNIGAIYSL